MELGSLSACIVLAGGTANRLHGVSKPDYHVAGRRLLDILADEIGRAGGAGTCIVVAPQHVRIPDHAQRALEDPPFGGPLAGIGAGIAALTATSGDALVALCTCDAPLTPRNWSQLVASLCGSDRRTSASLDNHDHGFSVEGVAGAVPVTVSADGSRSRFHYLHGVYTLAALRSLNFARNGSVRSAFADLPVEKFADTSDNCIDVDTDDDAQRLALRVG